MHIAQLREHEAELRELNAKVVIVTFKNDYFARRYAEETGLTWPLFIDESRETYRSYGMLTASFWDVWGPKTILAYARSLLRGQKLPQSEGDVYQRGGDVLVDPEGVVRLHHVGSGPADRPAPETILRIMTEGGTHSWQ